MDAAYAHSSRSLRWFCRLLEGPKLADKRRRSVLLALVLGDQRAIGDVELDAYSSRTGIGHLVSISGLHITMIAVSSGWLWVLMARSRCCLVARGCANCCRSAPA